MPLDRDTLENFGRQAAELLNNNPIKADIESQLRALATNTLSKLDVVTREEFEAQAAVLLRTRQKLEVLEQQLDELLKQNA